MLHNRKVRQPVFIRHPARATFRFTSASIQSPSMVSFLPSLLGLASRGERSENVRHRTQRMVPLCSTRSQQDVRRDTSEAASSAGPMSRRALLGLGTLGLVVGAERSAMAFDSPFNDVVPDIGLLRSATSGRVTLLHWKERLFP